MEEYFFWLMYHYFLVIQGTTMKSDKFINYFNIAINVTFHKRMELVGKKIDFEIISLFETLLPRLKDLFHLPMSQNNDNHTHKFIDFITCYYIRIRLLHKSDLMSQIDCRTRRIYTKLIHFKNE